MFSFCQSIKLLTKEITQNKYFFARRVSLCFFPILCVFFSCFLIKSCNQDVGMWEIGCIDGKFPFIPRNNEYLNTWFVNTELFHMSRKNSKFFFCLRHRWCDSVLIAAVVRIYNQWRMGEKAEKMRKLILMDFSYTIEIKHTEVSMMEEWEKWRAKINWNENVVCLLEN